MIERAVFRVKHAPRAARWKLALGLALGLPAACGGPQELGGAGDKCFRDDDCEPGLVCVAPPAEPGNRVCSNDPTPLISNVEGPPVLEPTGGTAGAGGGGAGGMGAAGAAAAAGTDVGGSGGSGAAAGTASAGSAGASVAGSGGTGEPAGGAPGAGGA